MELPYPPGFLERNAYVLRRGPGIMGYGFTRLLQYAYGYQVGMQEGGGVDQQVSFTQVAYKIGGTDLYGNTSQQFSEGYMENSLGLGVFASAGHAGVQVTATAPRRTDSFRRLGLDARLRYGGFVLHSGAVWGSNDNPYATLSQEEAKVRSWFVAPEYFWSPQLLTGVRYEEEDLNVPTSLGLGDRRRGRINIYQGLLLTTFVRFTLECVIYTDKRHSMGGEALDENQVFVTTDLAI